MSQRETVICNKCGNTITVPVSKEHRGRLVLTFLCDKCGEYNRTENLKDAFGNEIRFHSH